MSRASTVSLAGRDAWSLTRGAKRTHAPRSMRAQRTRSNARYGTTRACAQCVLVLLTSSRGGKWASVSSSVGRSGRSARGWLAVEPCVDPPPRSHTKSTAKRARVRGSRTWPSTRRGRRNQVSTRAQAFPCLHECRRGDVALLALLSFSLVIVPLPCCTSTRETRRPSPTPTEPAATGDASKPLHTRATHTRPTHTSERTRQGEDKECMCLMCGCTRGVASVSLGPMGG